MHQMYAAVRCFCASTKLLHGRGWREYYRVALRALVLVLVAAGPIE
jgi:hypothetical protein